MQSESSIKEIELELDKVHARAKAAFGAKDLDGYMAAFSPDLAYKQVNGKIIYYDQLKIDIASQFARVSRVESSFTREQIEWAGSEVVEHLTQTAIAEEKIFLVFTRKWQVHRRGLYTWSKSNLGWVISKVEVVEESVL